MKAVLILNEVIPENIYSSSTRKEISQQLELFADPIPSSKVLNEDYQKVLAEADIVFTGWGAPKFDAQLLDRMPNLKVIFYAGGTMKHILIPEVWKRQIRVTHANEANAIPVAKFTVSEVLFSLKNGWRQLREVKETRTFENGIFLDVIGGYQATVGIISFSSIGKRVVEYLKTFDLHVVVYDPYVDAEVIEAAGAEKVELDELFSRSQVISLHTPLLAETVGMITGELFSSMQKNATFINTARGAIVDQEAMIAVLQERPDLTAVLDVTDPEPPAPDSLLYDLENVVLTPHIAGSVGSEIERLGQYMADELKLYLETEKLNYEVTEEAMKTMA